MKLAMPRATVMGVIVAVGMVVVMILALGVLVVVVVILALRMLMLMVVIFTLAMVVTLFPGMAVFMPMVIPARMQMRQNLRYPTTRPFRKRDDILGGQEHPDRVLDGVLVPGRRGLVLEPHDIHARRAQVQLHHPVLHGDLHGRDAMHMRPHPAGLLRRGRGGHRCGKNGECRVFHVMSFRQGSGKVGMAGSASGFAVMRRKCRIARAPRPRDGGRGTRWPR